MTLKFPEQEDAKPTPQARYGELPEIKHMFRVPEKRPPTVVSTTFTVLCVIPLLILIILVRQLASPQPYPSPPPHPHPQLCKEW